MSFYIHQQDNWTNFTWDDSALSVPLGKVRNLQGKLTGKMEMLGFVLKQEAFLETAGRFEIYRNRGRILKRRASAFVLSQTFRNGYCRISAFG